MINKDPGKRHFYISMVKSAIRMFAATALFFGSLPLAGTLFLIAEILGVAEEI